MLTLRRFRTMAESYGADLRRWPEGVRGEAQALLGASGEARALLDEARRLDEAIEAASARQDAKLWQPAEQGAALARLRQGVAARIAPAAACRPAGRRMEGALAAWRGWTLVPRLRWMGMATSGGVAVMAGLLIGATYASAPAPDTLLSALQPAPIHLLAD